MKGKAVEQKRQVNSQSPDRVPSHDGDDSPDHNTTNKNKPNIKSRHSTGKVFMARQSLLTELMETPHIRSIHHIFVAFFIILLLHTVTYDLVEKGRINFGIGTIRIAFGKIDIVLYVWTSMQMAALLPHSLVQVWAGYRQPLVQFGKLVKIWDITWLCMFIIFQGTFVVLAISAVLIHNLPFASSLIVLLEMARFMMKIHAYVRSVCPRALHRSSPPTSTQLPTNTPLPPFSCYLYFLFAPTLIYRDSYPRTGYIRWRFVAARLMEIVALIFFESFICEHFLYRNFYNFGKADEVLEAKQLVSQVFGAMLPSLLTYVWTFYVLLHCWLNAAAEVLTFADRQFYLDWWSQSSFASFYRTWNMPVHDWFHTYVYKDVVMLTGSRLFGTLLVFSTSAIFHEVIIGFSLKLFYPVLLVLFGFIGVLLVFLTKQSSPSTGNIFMWWSLTVGNTVLWCLYGMEYYARRNCPASGETGIWDILIPRTWSCPQIMLRPDWKFHSPLDE